MSDRKGKTKVGLTAGRAGSRRAGRSTSELGAKIRRASRPEVAAFFRAVNRRRMKAETELLSASRLAMADEFYAAIVDGRIVGAVCLVLDEGKCSELLTEFVLKEYQGHGIGTRLTRAALERLIAVGRTPIYIDVASQGMDRTLDNLPKAVYRHLRLNRSYRKYGEVELPER